MNTSDYQAYLASREWALLRERVRQRCGNVCERCRRAPHQETHHVTYERCGHERLEDLLGVCSPCHRYLSGKSDHDPSRCRVFVAGPVPDEPMGGWRKHLSPLLATTDLVLPVRVSGKGYHGEPITLVTASEVVTNNLLAMSACCLVIGFLDHGNRVGTVVDLMMAANLRRRILLIDNCPGGTSWSDVGHGCGGEQLSEAWYLGAYLAGKAAAHVDHGLLDTPGAFDALGRQLATACQQTHSEWPATFSSLMVLGNGAA